MFHSLSENMDIVAHCPKLIKPVTVDNRKERMKYGVQGQHIEQRGWRKEHEVGRLECFWGV